MNCSSCGANLPPGAVVCPVCGASTPYNAGSPVYQPNVPASSYGGPTPPPQGYDPNAPTYISSPYGTPASQQQVPPTSYGSQPYDSNPYGAASNPYAPTDPYSAPVAPQPPLYPGGFPPPVQPPQRRSRLGLIIGIIVLVLVLACAGLVGLSVIGARNTVTNAVPTPTPVPTSPSPPGSPIVPSAAAILGNPKMASAIDTNYNPTTLTNTFTTNQKIFVTFSVNTGGKVGYAQAKWYINGKLDYTNPVITLQANYDQGFFRDITGTAGKGVVELYWCTQSNCSDAQLASIATFTVTAASTTGQPIIALMDIERRA